MSCPHTAFAADVTVNRLEPDEGAVVPFAEESFNAEVRIKCTECGEDFRFIGFEAGISPTHPMTDPSQTELRLPIQPSSRDAVGSWPTMRLRVRAPYMARGGRA